MQLFGYERSHCKVDTTVALVGTCGSSNIPEQNKISFMSACGLSNIPMIHFAVKKNKFLSHKFQNFYSESNEKLEP